MSYPTLRWPKGKLYACTTSWDDGRSQDRRVIELFNAHGVKGTFNLNSSNHQIGESTPPPKHIAAGDIASLFSGHEVAVHGATHPFPSQIAPNLWLEDVVRDKRALESLVGYTIRGAAWPYGDFNAEAIEAMRVAGIQYCRSVNSTGNFGLPAAGTWLTWAPTCHHLNDSLAKWTVFRGRTPHARLFYLWSHSYEMDEKDGWAWLEEFCKRAGPDPEVWHATNIEVFDYINAWRALSFSCDARKAHNPSALNVWVDYEGKTVELKPGKNSVG